MHSYLYFPVTATKKSLRELHPNGMNKSATCEIYHERGGRRFNKGKFSPRFQGHYKEQPHQNQTLEILINQTGLISNFQLFIDSKNVTKQKQQTRINYDIKLEHPYMSYPQISTTRRLRNQTTHDLRFTPSQSSPLAPDPPRKLNILGHNRHPLRMDRAQIRILKQSNQIRLRRLLERRDRRALEPEIGLEILSNLPHESLEGEFPDQQLRALLVLPNLPQRHRPRPEPVRLLHSSCGRRRLPCGLGR
ncbi:hypothetical protein AKJ16_DCAP18009 [Drosera capensis]